ncbi:MAG: metallophosphoesterase family protein [Planctomycetota bacterium]
MSVFAVVSDIHGNLEAIQAVLDDIKKQNISEIFCLGDTVGYGADPVKCMEVARNFKVALMGNHEWAILNEPLGFNASARQAITWAKGQLIPKWYSLGTTIRRWRRLKRLPKTYKSDGFLFVHGSPRSPIEEYILPIDVDETAGECSPKLKECFSITEWITFVGHSHTPGVYTEDPKYLSLEDINNRIKIEKDKKYVVNVGSVGQPRDRNWRSCYITMDMDTNEITYHRIEYDVLKAAAKIKRTGKMDDSLSVRLTLGA